MVRHQHGLRERHGRPSSDTAVRDRYLKFIVKIAHKYNTIIHVILDKLVPRLRLYVHDVHPINVCTVYMHTNLVGR